MSSVRGGEERKFRAERVEDLPAAENPEARAFPAEPPATAVRDAAHHG